MPQVLKLQKKYLNVHNLNCNISDNIEDFYSKKINLCVSTFAFSELTKSQRNKIINNIFPNCDNIFLVCNFINNENFEDQEIFNFLTDKHNCVTYKEKHEGHMCSVFLISKKQ